MPNKPKPVDLTVEVRTTALLVLDLNARCEDPKQACHKLVQPVAGFLARVRSAGLPILYTVSLNHKGNPEERMPRAFDQRENEPVLFPNAFDKFDRGRAGPIAQRKKDRDRYRYRSLQ